jgi:hypothetical protein
MLRSSWRQALAANIESASTRIRLRQAKSEAWLSLAAAWTNFASTGNPNRTGNSHHTRSIRRACDDLAIALHEQRHQVQTLSRGMKNGGGQHYDARIQMALFPAQNPVAR